MTRARIQIEQDRSTGQWLVVKHMRRGWSVLARRETLEEATDYARDTVDAMREFAREGH